jgi:phosphohistidine swiveling domain-containing protein
MTTLVPLREVRSAECGGAKAFHLAQLARNGIPIPEAFVLPVGSLETPGDELLEALGGRVAVRSSATLQDSGSASFAGQFQSFLNVGTPEELARAVAAVRASAGSEAVRAYCAARRIDPSEVRMAVLLQRMVQADTASVLFTVDPVSGREEDMLIEAVPGLADDLLGGRVSGVRIPVRDGQPLGEPDLLSTAQVRRLAEMGRRIQRLKGCPQDIEWAFAEDRLYILQARPVTRLGFAGIEGEWTNADFRDGGVASDVVTPLMWSLYEYIWDRALKGFLKDLWLFPGGFRAARVFYGRPYWNLTAVKRCARKLPGFVESEFDRDIGVPPRDSGSGARTPASLWNVLKALPTVVAAAWVLRKQERWDRELLRAGWPRQFRTDLGRLDNRSLLRAFRQLVEGAYRTTEENYFRTIFCVSVTKLDFMAAMEDVPVSYPVLVGGLDSLEHFECAQDLWELANGAPRGRSSPGEGRRRASEDFLARYGYHSRRELDLRVPRWREEPAFVAELARKMAGAESPAEANRRQRRQYDAELERARRLLSPRRWKRFEKLLLRLRKYLWLREQMRDLSTRVYAHIRQFVLEIGRRAADARHLRSSDDIFYLTFPEIYRALEAPRDAVVGGRRDYERMYRNFRVPNEVGGGFALTPVEPTGRRLNGIGCSTGVVSGRVRIVPTLADADKFQRGDILVCPFTDPGWTPLLNLAAGVITENGGLLSHAAVICREYAIPAVLNVAGATRVLRDNQRVRIDGGQGHVDIL